MTIVGSLTVPVPTRTPRARVGCRIPHPGRWGLSAGDPGSTRRQAVLPIFIVGTHPPVAQSPGGRVPQWSPRTGMAAPTAGPTPPTRPNPPSRRPCPRSPPCGPSSSSAGRSSGAALPDPPSRRIRHPRPPPERDRHDCARAPRTHHRSSRPTSLRVQVGPSGGKPVENEQPTLAPRQATAIYGARPGLVCPGRSNWRNATVEVEAMSKKHTSPKPPGPLADGPDKSGSVADRDTSRHATRPVSRKSEAIIREVSVRRRTAMKNLANR